MTDIADLVAPRLSDDELTALLALSERATVAISAAYPVTRALVVDMNETIRRLATEVRDLRAALVEYRVMDADECQHDELRRIVVAAERSVRAEVDFAKNPSIEAHALMLETRAGLVRAVRGEA